MIEILAGQYFDAETGLHHNYHRYYDPKTGRYITPDPIGLAGGINLYAYTENNPINEIDPFGLNPVGNFLLKLTKAGSQKIGKLSSDAATREARRQGKNVLAPNKQAAKAIERGAFGGSEAIMRHKGHKLPDGSTGRPHYQTKGKRGHTFWGGALAFACSLLDPFGAEALGNPEEDADGNGVPDYLETDDNPCP